MTTPAWRRIHAYLLATPCPRTATQIARSLGMEQRNVSSVLRLGRPVGRFVRSLGYPALWSAGDVP